MKQFIAPRWDRFPSAWMVLAAVLGVPVLGVPVLGVPVLGVPVLGVPVLGVPVPALADEVDFVQNVRPILQKHCYGCHGEQKQKSGLRLDVKAAAFAGGDLYEPGIVPGRADDSPLVQFVRDDDADLRMPPDGPRLSGGEIATLVRWIDAGAHWPDGVDLVQLEDRSEHWAFQPLPTHMVPVVTDDTWSRDDIDRFLLDRLRREGLAPAREADRVAWLRRVSIDLIGLPPTPEQAAAFQQDRSPDAYEKVVDVLLASPRYGERWAQHWLDVVRYADTHGFEVNTERPHAWPYRDYVIRAFNSDTPYDQFIREQIVGDALGQDAATGFLITASVLLPGQIGKDEPSKRLARQDALDEIVVNLGQTFLGLSVGCARCHDHKFDPISQQDYYAMQAFVAGVEYADRELQTAESREKRRQADELRARIAELDRQLAERVPLAIVGATPRRARINARINIDRFAPLRAQRVRFTVLDTNRLEPCLDELEVFDEAGTNVALAERGATVASSGDTVSQNRHELRFVNDGQYGNSRSWMSDETGSGWVEVALPHETSIERVVWGRDRQGKFTDRLAVAYRIEVAGSSGTWQTVADSSDREAFEQDKAGEPALVAVAALSPDEAQVASRLLAEREQLAERVADAERQQLAFAGRFRSPDEIHLLRRGDPEQPLQPVGPSVPVALGTLELPRDSAEQERRLALADWIASDENPLTARVMVNRIWQGHYGIGLIDTSNDFGRNGVAPTHPELLDWLAAEFIRSGWSVKQMHRRIVLSAAYRQASRHASDSAHDGSAQDGAVRLLWRYPTRRLGGEAIRDSVLAVSGRLNLQMGGAGFNLFDKRGGLTGFSPVESFTAKGQRRMIYAHRVRRERDAVFGAFDCPDFGQSTARRRESTTPIQALNLLNSHFVIEQSEAFAERVRAEVGLDTVPQIKRAYQLTLLRDPTAEEIGEAAPVVDEHGLPVLCRALLNSNEFLFLP